ncbi:MAG: hypothetical protein ABJA82_03130 [Myxococcales bacterium]
MGSGKCPQGLRSPLAAEHIAAIWVTAARKLGWQVVRGTSAYASTDGKGIMSIAVDESLDQQDAVAQLIFHELCHGLLEGPASWSLPDWGLSNTDDRDVTHEHACLRLQVHLTEAHGLRELMAPTTEYRAYHDELTGEPLQNAHDPAALLARQAAERPESRHWVAVLDQALAATRHELDAAATDPASERAPAAMHPVGFAFASHDQSCGTCAWLYRGGRGRPVERCRQSVGATAAVGAAGAAGVAVTDGNGRRTAAHFRACERWEPPVECQACGACCREAYHSVTISMRDPVVWKQPALVVRNGHRFEILRSGDHCAALTESPTSSISPPLATPAFSTSAAPRGLFACAIYQERPRPCREFEAGGRHCLVARRRVGLSP